MEFLTSVSGSIDFPVDLFPVDKLNRIDCCNKSKDTHKSMVSPVSNTDLFRLPMFTKIILPDFDNRKYSQSLPQFSDIKISRFHLNTLLVSYLKLPFLFSTVHWHDESKNYQCQIII